MSDAYDWAKMDKEMLKRLEREEERRVAEWLEKDEARRETKRQTRRETM